MPSVRLLGDENIHPGSGLSAFPSRKGTHCSHMADDVLNAKKIASLCRRKMKLPEGASRTWLCRAPKAFPWEGEEVPAPGPCSRFCLCFCVKSDEMKCIGALSTETFLEASYIYDAEGDCRTTGKCCCCRASVLFALSNKFIKVSTFECVIA